MPELELNHSGYDVRNRPSVGQDEAIPPIQRQQRKRPDARPNPRRNFPKETVQILQSWVDKHMHNPYADPEELKDLAAQTRLEIDQVRDWLARFRKRKMPKPTPTISTSTTSMEVESPFASLQKNRRQFSPSIKMYLDTSPRNDPFPLTAENLQNNTPDFSLYNNSVRRQSSLPPTQTGDKRTRQLSSQQSGVPVPSNDTAKRLKGKKGQRIISSPPAPRERREGDKFQCTFCNRGFKFHCDWARHEEVHAPQEIWICMLAGPRLVIAGDVTCPFCGKSDPTDDHLTDEHKADLCHQKTEEQRSFNRNDGLVRHMKDFHGASIHTAPTSWVRPKYENGDPHFWCGFCQKLLHMTWNLRLKHLGDHYTKDDYHMTRWVEIEPLNEYYDYGPVANLGFHSDVSRDLDSLENPGSNGDALPDLDRSENPGFNGDTSLDLDSSKNPGFNCDALLDWDSFEDPDRDVDALLELTEEIDLRQGPMGHWYDIK